MVIDQIWAWFFRQLASGTHNHDEHEPPLFPCHGCEHDREVRR
jgi:hypothetical protein